MIHLLLMLNLGSVHSFGVIFGCLKAGGNDVKTIYYNNKLTNNLYFFES
jgi:hypothetical protein